MTCYWVHSRGIWHGCDEGCTAIRRQDAVTPEGVQSSASIEIPPYAPFTAQVGYPWTEEAENMHRLPSSLLFSSFTAALFLLSRYFHLFAEYRCVADGRTQSFPGLDQASACASIHCPLRVMTRLTAYPQSGRSADEALKGVDLNRNIEALYDGPFLHSRCQSS